MERLNENTTDKDMKMLGAKIPTDIYWQFKAAASRRQERMEDAIRNAALLYIDIDKQKTSEEGK